MPGAQLWVSRYNGPVKSASAAAVKGSPDGSTVFVTGYSYASASGRDYATVAYDASTGSKRWVSRYNGPGSGFDNATALGVSPDGSTVFVTGSSVGSKSDADYATVAIDAFTGTKRWVSRYNGPENGDDSAAGLQVSPDGSTVFVTGNSTGSESLTDDATVAIDAFTGTKRWVSRYNGPVGGYDGATALGVSTDGSTVFVTGFSYGSATLTDYATVAMDSSTGAKRWVSRYDGPASSYDSAIALGVSPDGSTVVVTGTSRGSPSYNEDYATVAIAASSGTTLWVNRYEGPASYYDDATALGVGPDGTTVFVTGYSSGSTSGYDFATLAISVSSGATLWVSRYVGAYTIDDYAYGLGVSADGSKVFVTGYSDARFGSPDYATVAIDSSTGGTLWASRYNGLGNAFDSATAIAVSSDRSTVFVTGKSTGSAGSYDYATVAYSII